MRKNLENRKIENILVTGGCGFIGSAFIRRMFQNPTFLGKIVNLDKLTYAGNVENLLGHTDLARYELVVGDILDGVLVRRLCEQYSIDAIIHFAAESHVDRSIDNPLVFVETNVLGTCRLLDVVRDIRTIHFHHVSTDEVYGSLGPTGAFVETTPYNPRSPYSASKASSDHFVRAYAHTYGLSVTVSNCSNNYGPYQFPEKLIPLMILNMVNRKPLPIYGDGSNVRDWLHVIDHVDAIWRIVQIGASGETYNIGGGSERTNLELLHLLASIVSNEIGCSLKELESLFQFVKDRPGHDLRYSLDGSLLASLGWKPKIKLSERINSMVNWCLKNTRWLTKN